MATKLFSFLFITCYIAVISDGWLLIYCSWGGLHHTPYLKPITETNAKKVHSKPLSFGAFGDRVQLVWKKKKLSWRWISRCWLCKLVSLWNTKIQSELLDAFPQGGRAHLPQRPTIMCSLMAVNECGQYISAALWTFNSHLSRNWLSACRWISTTLSRKLENGLI